MQYLNKSFTVGLSNKKYGDGWDNIWGKKEDTPLEDSLRASLRESKLPEHFRGVTPECRHWEGMETSQRVVPVNKAIGIYEPSRPLET